MELRFKVSGRIARAVNEVFEAVADPGQLTRYKWWRWCRIGASSSDGRRVIRDLARPTATRPQ